MSLSRILEKKKRRDNLDEKNRIPVPQDDASEAKGEDFAGLEDEIFEQVALKLCELKGLSPPPLVRQTNDTVTTGPPAIRKNFLFISDSKISQAIRQQLRSYVNIRQFDQNFTNRTCDDLYNNNIQHLWINISNRQARRWLENNIKNKGCYTSVLVYRGSTKNKFLLDLEGQVDIVSKMKHLNRLNALSLDELINKLGNRVPIHSPANALMACLGCSKSIIKKKK